MVMASTNRLKIATLLLGLILLLPACVLKMLFYRSPKPQSFELFKTNKQGLQGVSKLRTDGFYYFFEEHSAYDPPDKKRIRYYQFKKDGTLNLSLGHLKANADSVYKVEKESIAKDLKDHYYGYYSATGDNIDMEYLQEEREFFGKDYRYRSMGRLSKNGDTLYVANETYTNKKETKALNRVCIFYEFPK
jgi:hypothetical protein